MALNIEQQKEHLRKNLLAIHRAIETARRENTRVEQKTLDSLQAFLNWLQVQFQTTSYLQSRIEVSEHLKRIANMEKLLPEQIRTQARSLMDQTQAPGEGVVTAPPQVEQSRATQAVAIPASRGRYMDVSGHGQVRVPDDSHPIFGVHGIARGILLKQGSKGRKIPIANPAVKRIFKKYGHNGIAVNTWYYSQLRALVSGAHGASNGGISGDSDHGAFSIVVAGAYDDRDLDTFAVLWYSPPRSTDSDESQGSKILHASLRSKQPVRVLRSSSGKSDHSPSVGMRYDGLYDVVAVKTSVDTDGAEHELFKLVRQAGQPPRDDNVPSAQQRADYELIKNGY